MQAPYNNDKKHFTKENLFLMALVVCSYPRAVYQYSSPDQQSTSVTPALSL